MGYYRTTCSRAEYRQQLEDSRKVIQILPVPPGQRVTAVFREEDGSERREPVVLIGLLADGDIQYIVIADDGDATFPQDSRDFIRYDTCFYIV